MPDHESVALATFGGALRPLSKATGGGIALALADQLVELMDDVAGKVDDADVRSAALDALAELGADAVPILSKLLERRELPLPLRRTVVTALASIETGRRIPSIPSSPPSSRGSTNGRSIRSGPASVLIREPDWWARALGLHYLGRYGDVTLPGRSKDEPYEGEDMIPLIERVMILKGSEFFRNFPGSELAGIAALSQEVHARKGDVIFEQGDDGDAFYIVVQGAVVISRGSTRLATLGPREGFGEMAILDRDTRSATATASEDTTLLALDRDSFDQVIEQNPIVARGVYRVLTQRLRNTLAQVAAG